MKWETPNERAQGAGAEPDLAGFARAVQLLTFAYLPGSVPESADRAEVVTDLSEAPGYAALIPRLFEVDQVVGIFGGAGWPGLIVTRDRPRLNIDEVAELHDLCDGHTWPDAFAALAADGVVDGATLLDACLGALQRGVSPACVRGFLRVHDALASGVDDVAARVSDYAALLSGSHSGVAAAAQRELRRLDEAGGLEPDTLLDASRVVLSRTEKKLVRAQLSWLDHAARRGHAGHAGHAGQVARVAATAFTQEAADLQKRALTVAIKHATADVHAELAEAAAALPADLRARAGEAFGPIAAAGPVPLVPPAWEPPPPPKPIASPGELAEELAALFAGPSGVIDPVALERVLAALVAFAAEDRTVLREALAPVMKRQGISPGLRQESRVRGPYGFDMIASITGSAVAPVRTNWGWAPRYFAPDRTGEGPEPVLRLRLAEIALRLDRAPRPLLMATPTTATGLIDPAELLARIEREAREEWPPWPYDVELALLRLPREVESGIADRARRLGTPAGERLAEWIGTGGLPTPETRREAHVFHEMFTEHHRARVVLTAAPHAGPIARALTNLPAPREWDAHGGNQAYGENSWLPCWPAMLPAYREIAAAHMLPSLASLSATGRGLGHALPLLAEADGPAGPAMTLAFAYGLAARNRGDRVCAVDALLTLAARGGFDWAALGREISGLGLPLNRIVPALRELAHAGAWQRVWELIAAALPSTLPPAAERPPQRLADLVALGVEVAEAVRPGTTIPELRAVAGRGDSSRLSTEARRLLAVL